MGICDEVRESCGRLAAAARHVRIDVARRGADDRQPPVEPPPLDPQVHFLDGPREDVAAFVLALDAINFGSGWFPTLRKRIGLEGRPVSGYTTVAWYLADLWRAGSGWSPAELRGLSTLDVAAVVGQEPDHELMALYAQALRDLGRFLGDRGALDVVEAAGGSAQRLAEALARGMALFDDRGFYKRAQITANDLQLAGVAAFADIDTLTIFADNLVPHVLRCDGILVYDDDLAAWIDSGRLLPMDAREREIRACAVHACELLSARLGIAPRILDVWLWNRGQAPEYKARPRHRCRTVFY